MKGSCLLLIPQGPQEDLNAFVRSDNDKSEIITTEVELKLLHCSRVKTNNIEPISNVKPSQMCLGYEVNCSA